MVLKVEVDEEGVPFLQLGKQQMRLDLEELKGEFKERAIRELRETPENVEEGLKKLKELIQAEKNVYVPLDDDKYLMKFLRPFKFNGEQAFKVMRKYYKFIHKHPKYGSNLTPDSVRHVLEDEVCEFLPTRTKSGSRIMIINIGTKWNPSKVKIEDMFKCIFVAVEIAMLEPKTQVGGVHVIINLEGLSLMHLYQFSPAIAKLIIDFVQDCTPVRLKGIHIVNQSYIFNMLYGIFKPFIGEYIKKRLYFHGTKRALLTEKMDAESLPERFGGTAGIPHCPGHLFADILFYYENDFKVHTSYGYVEDKEKAPKK